MRILIYTHEFLPFLGGLGTTSLNLAKGLSARGHEVIVLAPDYPEKSPDEDELYNFEIIRMGMFTRNHGVPTPIKEIRGYFHLKKQFESYRPESLIALTREAHAACGFNTSILPENSIARVAGYEAFRYLMGRRFRNRMISIPMRRFYDKCSAIVAASSATRELFVKAGIGQSKVKVIYNGVDPQVLDSEIDPARTDELRRKFGISINDKVLLTVSRIVPGKGQDMVIRSLPALVKKYKTLKYVIVGKGEYGSALNDLANKLGVKDNVIFTGPVPYRDVKYFYDLGDIFIMANRTEKKRENVEGLPNVIYEAASRGKPIIAGIPGGASEIVENGFNGYIVDGNSIQQITERVAELLNDPEKCSIFGNRLKELIRNGYTTDHMIDGYESLLLC